MAEGHLEGTEVYNLGLSFPLRQKRTKCPWDSFPLRLVWPKLSRRLWAWGRTTSPLAHGNDNPSTQTFWDKEVHENSLSLTVLCLHQSFTRCQEVAAGGTSSLLLASPEAGIPQQWWGSSGAGSSDMQLACCCTDVWRAFQSLPSSRTSSEPPQALQEFYAIFLECKAALHVSLPTPSSITQSAPSGWVPGLPCCLSNAWTSSSTEFGKVEENSSGALVVPLWIFWEVKKGYNQHNW